MVLTQTVMEHPVQSATAESLIAVAQRLRAEIGKRIVGQTAVVEEVVMAMLAGGHALLVGVPGLAKTLMIRTIADVMRLEFRRIQFTPDLVPSDITGTEILDEDTTTGHRQFRFVRGPIFANIVLADEINRTGPHGVRVYLPHPSATLQAAVGPVVAQTVLRDSLAFGRLLLLGAARGAGLESRRVPGALAQGAGQRAPGHDRRN